MTQCMEIGRAYDHSFIVIPHLPQNFHFGWKGVRWYSLLANKKICKALKSSTIRGTEVKKIPPKDECLFHPG